MNFFEKRIYNNENFAVDFEEPKEKKLRWDQPEDVIKKILDARQLIYEHSSTTLMKVKYNER